MTDTPALDGIHHIKLPVRDLHRARDWYESRLGYQPGWSLTRKDGTVSGCTLVRPQGGPMIGLSIDPDAAEQMPSFELLSIGVPTKADLQALERRLTELEERHAGIHKATLGWVLPMVTDPDGHLLAFYTTEQHTTVSAARALHDRNVAS